jgi:hypothetical protein
MLIANKCSQWARTKHKPQRNRLSEYVSSHKICYRGFDLAPDANRPEAHHASSMRPTVTPGPIVIISA